jgi:hypothetical protein
LRELFARGKPFFGLSAGSIMLAKEWVRWPDPDNLESAELFTCLGFAPVICDTHDEEGDFEELQAALALKPDGSVGYGIPSGAAIKVSPDDKVEALGGKVWQYTRQGENVKRIEDLKPLS